MVAICPWDFLIGMAQNSVVLNAGATILPGVGHECNMLQHVGAGDEQLLKTATLHWVKTCCSDSSWQLKCGDIVYFGSDETRSSLQIGLGDDEREVRVRYLDEPEDRWSTGRWVRTDFCHKLEVGDSMVVCSRIVDASTSARELAVGTVCW